MVNGRAHNFRVPPFYGCCRSKSVQYLEHPPLELVKVIHRITVVGKNEDDLAMLITPRSIGSVVLLYTRRPSRMRDPV
jgi:hypothetical protein